MIKRTISFLNGATTENILARGSIISFFLQGTGAGLVLLTDIFAARILGVSQFGIYSMVTAWIYILGLIGTLGFNHALLKYVPSYLAHADWGHFRGIIRRSNLWVGTISLTLAGCGILTLLTLKECCMNSALFFAFIVAFIGIPFQALSSLRQATLRGLEKIAHALIPEFILRPILFIILLGTLSFIGPKSPDATHAVSLNLIAVITAFIAGAYWQHKHLPPNLRNNDPIYIDREWWLTALPLLLIVGLSLISFRIDIIMLGLLSNVEHVAVYSAASRIADVIVFGLVAANAVVVPMISRLHSTGRHEDLQKLVRLASKNILLFTIPLTATILIFGKEILNLFGPEFSTGYSALVILILGQLFSVFAGPVGYLMMMTGHQRSAAKIASISAITNLVLNVIFIPMFGMIGAAISTAISLALLNMLLLKFVRKELSIEPTIFVR